MIASFNRENYPLHGMCIEYETLILRMVCVHIYIIQKKHREILAIFLINDIASVHK